MPEADSNRPRAEPEAREVAEREGVVSPHPAKPRKDYT